jgi:nucleotide-binding universal stress UspA family protein
MSTVSVPGVVVGIDASPQVDEVLDWAADEAVRRGVPLHIVHAWSLAGYQVPERDRGDVAQAVADGGNEILQRALDHVNESHSGLTTDTMLMATGAVPGLISRADHAEVIVVGHRGRSRLTSALIGSVSQSLAAHSPRPVVVVRGGGQDGDVVLGAAHDTAAAVVDFAFAEAGRRGTRLRVVRAWRYPQAYPGIVAIAPTEEARLNEEEGLSLAESLAAARKAHPEVEVVPLVGLDEPDAALIDASAGAALLVVGAERKPHHLGLPLGPVTQRVLHHAHCPVAVVPHT